jgi:DNA polymerase theta
MKFQVIASGVASSPLEVRNYANCTLMAASIAQEEQKDCGEKSQGGVTSENTENSIVQCINFLEKNELIRYVNKKVERFALTLVGIFGFLSSFSLLNMRILGCKRTNRVVKIGILPLS